MRVGCGQRLLQEMADDVKGKSQPSVNVVENNTEMIKDKTRGQS